MSRVLLHIGAHKTGTTAFQLWASSHTAWLETGNGIRVFEGLRGSSDFESAAAPQPRVRASTSGLSVLTSRFARINRCRQRRLFAVGQSCVLRGLCHPVRARPLAASRSATRLPL